MNLYYFKINSNKYVSVWHDSAYEAYCQVKRYFDKCTVIIKLEERPSDVTIDYLY